MSYYDEVVAVYHNMDYSNLSNIVDPYYEFVLPLIDWCKIDNIIIYNVYLDDSRGQALKELLKDAKKKKFKKIVVMKEEILKEFKRDIHYALASYGVVIMELNLI